MKNSFLHNIWQTISPTLATRSELMYHGSWNLSDFHSTGSLLLDSNKLHNKKKIGTRIFCEICREKKN